MDQFTMAEFAKNSENKEGAEFTPSVQEDGISQGTLIVSKLYNTMLGEITKYLRSINAELINVLDEAGISPSALSEEQLYTAIKKIVEQSHGRNVGDVYFSYSSNAADNVGGLPLFTGELISNADNLYPQFYAWLGEHPEVCTTESSWQNAIGTYGECPKYVLNTNDRTIRLPILKNYLKMANTTDGITQAAAGLPAHTHDVTVPHAETDSGTGMVVFGSGSPGEDVTFVSGAASSSIYGNSNTVTPAHTTLYPWVCVYNEAIPASTTQAAEFQAALSGKADIDLGNITDAGKVKSANLSKPTRTVKATSLAVPVANTPFYAPADGYYCLVGSQNVQIISYDDNGNQGLFAWGLGLVLPVSKGQMCRINYTSASQVLTFGFVYSTGAESEAS